MILQLQWQRRPFKYEYVATTMLRSLGWYMVFQIQLPSYECEKYKKEFDLIITIWI